MPCKSDYYNHTSKEFRKLFKEEYEKKRRKTLNAPFLMKALEKYDSLSDLIIYGIFWAQTKDGIQFWLDIYKNLLKNKKYLKKWNRE